MFLGSMMTLISRSKQQFFIIWAQVQQSPRCLTFCTLVPTGARNLVVESHGACQDLIDHYLNGAKSLRSVRGEKHILEMFKDSSPQGVNAECGVNRAAGAGGQIGHFSLDFAVMMHLCCGPARATAASSSKSPPLVARFDLRRGAPHLTPPRAPPPEPSCGRPMYGEDRRVACKFRSTIPVGAFGRVWFVPWRARRAKMWPFLHGAALGDFPRSTAPLGGGGSGSK